MDPKNAIIRTSLLVLVFVLFAATALPVVGQALKHFQRLHLISRKSSLP